MHFKQCNNSLLFGAIISILLGSMFFAMSAQALDSNELIAVANGQERDSVKLARLYMKQRKIPEENLLILQTAVSEGISRQVYEKEPEISRTELHP